MKALPDLLQDGIDLHQRGRLTEAKERYQQVIAMDAQQPDALHLLGLVEHQQGSSSTGVALIEKAIALRPRDVVFLFNLANMLQDMGQHDAALSNYELVLKQQPNSVDAMLGLGSCQQALQRPIEALSSYQRALSLASDRADLCFNVANCHARQGDLVKACDFYQRAIRIQPLYGDAHFQLSIALQTMGRYRAALESGRQAAKLMANDPQVHLSLGRTLLLSGLPSQAQQCFRLALKLKPDDADTRVELGVALMSMDQADDAIECFEAARRIDPKCASAYLAHAEALKTQEKFAQAAELEREVLALWPDLDSGYINLARTLMLQNKLDESNEQLHRAMGLKTARAAEACSQWLFNLQLQENLSAAEVFQAHQRYAEKFERPLQAFVHEHSSCTDPDKKLKIGYVSGDFRDHVVAYFFEPILAHHNRQVVEIFGYYSYVQRGDITRRIAAGCDHWLDCYGCSDDQLAARICEDGIDILVDLSGHTAFNRLLVFARKPAPVQATWIGYPGSTGLTSIDYRITDPWQDPPGLTERYHSEKLIRLPSGMAFEPDPASPVVNPLPALKGKGLMLACLNNLSKVNPQVIALWSRILHALPQARLMLGNASEYNARKRLIDLFAQHQISPERLALQPRVPTAQYLALHHQIDLALDPFPYNGGTTTMHSLWMGVPVVTLAGDHAVSRLCAAHLSRVGLTQFISHTEDEYLQCVVRAVADLPSLNVIRQGLRARMMAADVSPATITRQLEDAYRQMWRTWCASKF